jgi:WD40 repeat protein
MLTARTRTVDADVHVASLRDVRRALVRGLALNAAWIERRCMWGGGSVVDIDRNVCVAAELVADELHDAQSASVQSELRVLEWLRHALEQQSHSIRRDPSLCASYLWASLEPVMRECTDDGARAWLVFVVSGLHECRRASPSRANVWLAVTSAGEMSAASALVRSLPGHDAAVRAVTCGRGRIVSASEDCTLRVWDTESFECLGVLAGHTQGVLCLSDVFVNAEGHAAVASGSKDKSIRVWDIDSGMCVKALTGHTDWVRSISHVFTPVDGPHRGRRYIVSASDDTSVRAWDVDDGVCVQVMTGHAEAVLCVCAWSASWTTGTWSPRARCTAFDCGTPPRGRVFV